MRWRCSPGYAELGSFSKAAEKLGLAPASVSVAIQNLEAELGVRLITRTTRKLSLTDDGRAYLEPLGLLAEIEELEAALRQTRTRPQGKLRVEMPTAMGHLYVTPALPAFSEKYPDLQVIVTLNDRFVDLTEEDVDVIVPVGEAQRFGDGGAAHLRRAFRRLRLASLPEAPRRPPRDLAKHNCIGYFSASLGRSARWNFRREGASRQ